ncbi:hypothetical protein Sjap_010213 [Stephania japonica]|uniref:Uncharacterized protein n=1 Tax=Stephania japonica TaxID=461633 RepID=A0AAP0J915_9MAGN
MGEAGDHPWPHPHPKPSIFSVMLQDFNFLFFMILLKYDLCTNLLGFIHENSL